MTGFNRFVLFFFGLLAVAAFAQDDSEIPEGVKFEDVRHSRITNRTISVTNTCSSPLEGSIDLGSGLQNGWSSKGLKMTPLTVHLSTSAGAKPCSVVSEESSDSDVTVILNLKGNMRTATMPTSANFELIGDSYYVTFQWEACDILKSLRSFDAPLEDIEISVDYMLNAMGVDDSAYVRFRSFGHAIVYGPTEGLKEKSLIPVADLWQVVFIRQNTTCAGSPKSCFGEFTHWGETTGPRVDKINYVSIPSGKLVPTCSSSPNCKLPVTAQAVYHSFTRVVDPTAEYRWVNLFYTAPTSNDACAKKA